MGRYDLHRVDNALVLDVQSNIIPRVGTRLVIPLFEEGTVPRAMSRLHPILDVGGRDYVLATHLMAAMPISQLGPAIGSLDHLHDTIRAALDMIFLGF